MEEHGTQRKVLENALESLEYDEDKPGLSEEEEIWLRIPKEINSVLTILPLDLSKILFETMDVEELRGYVNNLKHVESLLEYNYKKPLKEFTLPELIQGIMLNIEIQNSSDTMKCEEYEDHFMIYLTHRLGEKCSQCLVIMNGSVFDSVGVRYEAKYSQRSVFFKVYKE